MARTVAFFSYTRFDDRESGGRLSLIRQQLEAKLRRVLGYEVEVFQDTDDIKIGQNWRTRLEEALGDTVFLVVIVTPSYFNSAPCQEELARFLEKEKALQRNDLIIPIYWEEDRDLERLRKNQPLLRPHEGRACLNKRQFASWRDLAEPEFSQIELERRVLSLARGMAETLDKIEGAEAVRKAREAAEVERVTAERLRREEEYEEKNRQAALVALRKENPWAFDIDDDQFGRFARFRVKEIVTTMRWIPPGEFLMGSPEDEQGRSSFEGPQTEIRFARGFWLMEAPVTQALYQAITRKKPSYFDSPDRPVEQINWHEAQAFIEAINGRFPGLNLRLPSESEWEYACRAGTTTATYIGPMQILGERNAPVLDEIAWYSGNSGVDFDLAKGDDSRDWKEKQYPHTKAGTRRIKLKEPNAWGLYDMLGNVWEWCADEWRQDLTETPRDGQPYVSSLGREGVRARVIRGGSWWDQAALCRAAARVKQGPNTTYNTIGFRLARDA